MQIIKDIWEKIIEILNIEIQITGRKETQYNKKEENFNKIIFYFKDDKYRTTINNNKKRRRNTMNSEQVMNLKNAIESLSTGLGEEANEIISALPISLSLDIQIEEGTGKGTIVAFQTDNPDKKRKFYFEGGACSKNNAIKRALSYLVDLCYNKEDEERERRKASLKSSIRGMEDDFNDIEDEISELEEELATNNKKRYELELELERLN